MTVPSCDIPAPLIFKYVPSNVNADSAFTEEPPVAVIILLLELLDTLNVGPVAPLAP